MSAIGVLRTSASQPRQLILVPGLTASKNLESSYGPTRKPSLEVAPTTLTILL